MQVRGFFGEGEIIAPPRVIAPALPATGFILCPPALMPVFWAHRGVQEIYRLAYEQRGPPIAQAGMSGSSAPRAIK